MLILNFKLNYNYIRLNKLNKDKQIREAQKNHK